jgi:hypothetical protein
MNTKRLWVQIVRWVSAVILCVMSLIALNFCLFLGWLPSVSAEAKANIGVYDGMSWSLLVASSGLLICAMSSSGYSDDRANHTAPS